jgi:hypothetical protein
MVAWYDATRPAAGSCFDNCPRCRIPISWTMATGSATPATSARSSSASPRQRRAGVGPVRRLPRRGDPTSATAITTGGDACDNCPVAPNSDQRDGITTDSATRDHCPAQKGDETAVPARWRVRDGNVCTIDARVDGAGCRTGARSLLTPSPAASILRNTVADASAVDWDPPRPPGLDWCAPRLAPRAGEGAATAPGSAPEAGRESHRRGSGRAGSFTRRGPARATITSRAPSRPSMAGNDS